jgi:hypothetical protein
VGTVHVSQMALGPVRKALTDAEIDGWTDPELAGLYVGTGVGGTATMNNCCAALYTGGRVPPLTMPAGKVIGRVKYAKSFGVSICQAAALAIARRGMDFRRSRAGPSGHFGWKGRPSRCRTAHEESFDA